MKKKSRRTNKTLMYVSQARKIDDNEEAREKSTKTPAALRKADVAVMDSSRKGYMTSRAAVKPINMME